MMKVLGMGLLNQVYSHIVQVISSNYYICIIIIMFPSK